MGRDERLRAEQRKLGRLGFCSSISQGVTRDVWGVAPADGRREDGPMASAECNGERPGELGGDCSIDLEQKQSLSGGRGCMQLGID